MDFDDVLALMYSEDRKVEVDPEAAVIALEACVELRERLLSIEPDLYGCEYLGDETCECELCERIRALARAEYFLDVALRESFPPHQIPRITSTE